MSRADAIYASRLSLRELFPGKVLDSRVEVLIDEIVERCNPPIRVVSESTWALKAAGLVHCAVCENVLGVRVELPRESGGRCPEHADWKIFYKHHSWNESEQSTAALEHLKRWRAEASGLTEISSDSEFRG